MRIYIVFIAILFTSCNTRNSNEFLKIVTNDSVIWIFYEGDYLHYKKLASIQDINFLKMELIKIHYR